MGTKPIDKPKEGIQIWYPMNEATAQRLNDPEYQSRRVLINKFLFPHGCLCWRECPSCGKLSSYLGDSWDIASSSLLPPPPLKGFARQAGIKDLPDDERSCVHCGISTFAEHTQTLMQSNFKPRPASFIEEIKRDLRVATNAANHIIFMGYSFPPDDVEYRAFFASRRKRVENGEKGPICSVIIGRGYEDRWIEDPREIEKMMKTMERNKPPYTTLESAISVFGKENVRFYGAGIPQVFCEGEKPSEKKFRKLIEPWG